MIRALAYSLGLGIFLHWRVSFVQKPNIGYVFVYDGECDSEHVLGPCQAQYTELLLLDGVTWGKFFISLCCCFLVFKMGP